MASKERKKTITEALTTYLKETALPEPLDYVKSTEIKSSARVTNETIYDDLATMSPNRDSNDLHEAIKSDWLDRRPIKQNHGEPSNGNKSIITTVANEEALKYFGGRPQQKRKWNERTIVQC